MKAVRRHPLLYAGALLLAGLLSGPAAQADSDDDIPPPVVAPPGTTSPELQIHHHGGGGDDDPALRRTLRSEDTNDDVFETSRGPGLALGRTYLPGELAATPEDQPPLFSKPTDGLARQPDPWAAKAK